MKIPKICKNCGKQQIFAVLHKRANIILFVCVILFSFYGCVSPKVVMLSNSYPPKAEDANIDVYITNLPTQEYVEFAKITCAHTNDNLNMQQILKKARSIGADGIIILGEKKSYGIVISGMVFNEQYGMTVIAIKYK
jgi:hypothetical protein